MLLLLAVFAMPARAFAAPTRILAFGDSLTAGYGLPANEAFPAQLAARLKADGYDVTVENGGVSGETSSGGLARLGWALGSHPNIVLLELGANDALRGTDPKLTKANLDKILARLTEAHIKVLFIGMEAPNNWGPTYRKAFDAIYPALAAKFHVAFYPFFLAGVALDPKLNQADGIHPNAAGVAVIVARIAPYVERLLKKPEG